MLIDLLLLCCCPSEVPRLSNLIGGPDLSIVFRIPLNHMEQLLILMKTQASVRHDGYSCIGIYHKQHNNVPGLA